MQIKQNNNLPYIYIINFQFLFTFSLYFCSKTNTNKIEKIKERALRFVYDDYNINGSGWGIMISK